MNRGGSPMPAAPSDRPFVCEILIGIQEVYFLPGTLYSDIGIEGDLHAIIAAAFLCSDDDDPIGSA